MPKSWKMLGAAAIAAAMAASAQAATAFDLTAEFATDGGSTLHAFMANVPGAGVTEPFTMIVLGTILLTVFRGTRQV
jgi:hypothetical protein